MHFGCPLKTSKRPTHWILFDPLNATMSSKILQSALPKKIKCVNNWRAHVHTGTYAPSSCQKSSVELLRIVHNPGFFYFCSFVSENDYFLIFWETPKSNVDTSKTKVVARCLNLLILFYPVQKCCYLAEKWSKTFSRVTANTDIIYSIAKFCCYGFS